MTDKPLLWTQASLATATGGSVSTPFECTGISIDSRTVQKGDLFVALKNQRDGHYFIRTAYEKGASAALVLWRPRGLPRDLPLVFVKNTLTGLEDMGKAARARTLARIIAVTGSVGKTTTKEAFRHVLKEFGLTHASEASYNNHWGVPLSLARMPFETKFGIFEAGMNHAGELTKLSEFIRPHIAVITTVAAAHLAHFESEEAIARAKAELFDGVEEGGTAILPYDNAYFPLLKEYALSKGLRVVAFGWSEGCDVHWIKDESPQENYKTHGQQVNITVAGIPYSLELSAFGDHMVMNSLAVIAGVHVLGLDLEKALVSLKSFTPVKGRGDVQTLHLSPEVSLTLMNESYNANPCSMKAALKTLKQWSEVHHNPPSSQNQNAESENSQNENAQDENKGRKIAFLGDMLELGDYAIALHEDLADDIKKSGVDHVILVGDVMECLVPLLKPFMAVAHYKTIEMLIEQLDASLFMNNDLIMVKSSHGTGLWKLCDKLFTYHQQAERKLTS
jgi:UDP-N-acetylmuramoyl-tripeptide--D-alanyl-D-alanine ligase